MKINKHILSTIKKDFIFLTGEINIDKDYFISKIEKGIKEKNNLNHRTNVSGYMTDWNYFNNDPEFTRILVRIMNYIEKHSVIDRKVKLENVWGIKENFSDRTKLHDHAKCILSGVIYLSTVDQKLIFPQIKQEVSSKEGNVVIFSGFLEHGTNERILEDKSKYALAFNLIEHIDF